MQIVKSLVVKKFVDGKGHRVADAQHRTESIGTRTQMRYLTQEFERMALLLKRIRFGVGLAVHLQLPRLYFDTLAGTGRFDKQPRAQMQAPVVIRFNNSPSKAATSATIWILLIVEPSLRAMNATFLFPLLVRTHPFTTTSVSTRPERSSSATIVLFTSDIALILYSLRYFFQTKRKYRHFFPILTQERRHKWAGKPQKTSLYRTDDTIALSVPYKSNIFVSVRTRVPHHALTGHAYGRLQETDRR